MIPLMKPKHGTENQNVHTFHAFVDDSTGKETWSKTNNDLLNKQMNKNQMEKSHWTIEQNHEHWLTIKPRSKNHLTIEQKQHTNRKPLVNDHRPMNKTTTNTTGW